MAATLAAQIASFFDGLQKAEEGRALLFTTFGLDEVVLVELLQTHRIARDVRIVVFHEIMKHRHPGYLHAHYPRSRVVSVNLAQTSKKHRCPVFHSKLWMSVTRSPARCERLAVHSFNLTRFHLSDRGRTHESFALWRSIAADLPRHPLFRHSRIFGESVQRERLKLAPSTVVIDLRDGASLALQMATRPAAHWLTQLGVATECCAAPFVGLNALRFLAGIGGEDLSNASAGSVLDRITAWSDRRRDDTVLHAKVIDLGRHYCFGSANLTSQALGIGHARAINHEAIVLSLRPSGFRLAKHMRGFRRLTVDDFGPDASEPAGDVDDTDPTSDHDWVAQKRRATRGPDAVDLRPAAHGDRAEVHMRGSICPIDQVVLESDGVAPLVGPPAKVLRFGTDARQRHLARLVRTGRVTVRGTKRRAVIWQRELDLGDLWPLVAMRQQDASGHDGAGTGGQRDGRLGASFSDVRALRFDAYRSGSELGPVAVDWHPWLRRYGGDIAGTAMPAWCRTVANRIRGLRDG